MASQKFLIKQLGGHNSGADAASIADNEFASISNMYPFAQRHIRRGGLEKLTIAGAFAENVNSMFAYKIRAGTWKLLVFGAQNIGFLDGDTITEIPRIGDDITSGTGAFTACQYKDIVYFGRESADRMKRTDGVTWQDAGIDQPATACTIAQGGAGDLGAGDYISVVTFYNSTTAMESNPGPVSNTLTLAASKLITYTGIPVSDNPQVTSRRIYRTLVGQQGEYYFVTEITDNTTTTLSEDVLQADMGDQASYDNGVPEMDCKAVVIWNERAWLTDGVDVWFSEFGLPECFSEFSFIAVNPDDGHSVTGILPFGDSLLVGKTNATYYVIGTDESDFDIRVLSDRFGVVSHQSMATAEGMAFWFGGENFYKSDGNQTAAIGDVAVRDIVDSIDPAYYSLVRAVINDKKGWYVCGVPADGATSINKLLIYNYREDNWSVFEYAATCPKVLADFYGEDAEAVIYCGLGTGHVYQWDTGNDDDGTAIEVDVLSKKFGIDTDDMLKIVRQCTISTNKIAANVEMYVMADDVEIDSAEGYLYYDTPWKRIQVTNRGTPGVYVQVGYRYDEAPSLEVKGFGFEMIQLNRRPRPVTAG